MQTVVVTPPTEEPITLAEAKRHAQLPEGFADDDAYLQLLIAAAREHVEELTGRAFVRQTLETSWDDFPRCGGIIRLPRAPVQSITSVGYVDSTDAPIVLDPTAYRVVVGTPGKVLLPYSGTGAWPAAALSPAVRYVVGYGDPDDVPPVAKMCISILVAHWYERRLPVAAGQVSDLPFSVQAFMAQLRWGNYPT